MKAESPATIKLAAPMSPGSYHHHHHHHIHQNHVEDELTKRNRAVHQKLQLLRADEAVALAETVAVKTRQKRKKETFWYFTSKEISRYIGYLVKTWSRSFSRVFFGGSVHPAEILPIFVFAGISSFLLFLLLLYCIYARIPSPLFESWAKEQEEKHAPSMFEAINNEQVDAAKRAMSLKMGEPKLSQNTRIFNLDIAKLCCQLSALMYSHDNNHSLEVMNDLQNRKATHTAKAEPTVDPLRAKLNALGFGVSTVENDAATGVEGFAATVEDPGALVAEIFGGDAHDAQCAAQKLGHDLGSSAGDSEISRFCTTFGIEYEPVSELNSSSAAYCSMFWDKSSNWIILAFKGTGPTDFAEWMTDLDYTMTHGGSWLKGFGRVHGGFVDRIFPRDVKELGGRRPYDTIASAIKIVGEELAKNNVGKVNLYFTGHSLGTAIASLTYARAVSGTNDFGKKVVVRDAYLFATPIICDVPSVHAFNFTMFKDLEKPRTMWRISNVGSFIVRDRNDIVATGLPEEGDRPVVPNPNSLFCFAHLGTEIRLPDKLGQQCFASGNHITQGTNVRIQSEFNDDMLYAHRQEGLIAGQFHDYANGKRESDPWLDIPVIGSLLAHGVGNYWESLSKVGNGACIWVDD
ncbi:hypothetical protein FRB96_003795 [Tulasnella sp. 330]|nr:hypothetical protein FRB96_003795 [Tulasnella sp. 330]KAG8883439.1 hypothetical protein FRB97_006567 [Tulasnella sp. 331]KAG8888393.1 hypothetical protein FRB98_007688 [Tulasnella sp. 332]